MSTSSRKKTKLQIHKQETKQENQITNTKIKNKAIKT